MNIAKKSENVAQAALRRAGERSLGKHANVLPVTDVREAGGHRWLAGAIVGALAVESLVFAAPKIANGVEAVRDKITRETGVNAPVTPGEYEQNSRNSQTDQEDRYTGMAADPTSIELPPALPTEEQ